MVLRFRTQVLEDRLFPVSLHVVPVVNHAVSNGVVNVITRRLLVGDCFIANEEVKILHASFRG